MDKRLGWILGVVVFLCGASLLQSSLIRSRQVRNFARLPEAAQLGTEDLALLAAQRICPVCEVALGKLGSPQKLELHGQPVIVCCERCGLQAKADPVKYLARSAQLKSDQLDSGDREE